MYVEYEFQALRLNQLIPGWRQLQFWVFFHSKFCKLNGVFRRFSQDSGELQCCSTIFRYMLTKASCSWHTQTVSIMSLDLSRIQTFSNIWIYQNCGIGVCCNLKNLDFTHFSKFEIYKMMDQTPKDTILSAVVSQPWVKYGEISVSV